MITNIAKFLGVDALFVKLGGIGLVILFIGGWLVLHDRKIVKQHENKVTIEVLKADKKAVEGANSSASDLAKKNKAASEKTKGEIENAIIDNPKEVNQSAGPASNAAARSLRERSKSSSGQTRTGKNGPS